MKRVLKLLSGILLNRYNEESWSISFEISYNELPPLILELKMVQDTLTESVILCSTKSVESINILLSIKGESEITQEGGRFNIILSEKDIGVVTSYLLQYYRDYCAPVSHVDIELAHQESLGKDATLVIKATAVNEPMTEEEVRKILGM